MSNCPVPAPSQATVRSLIESSAESLGYRIRANQLQAVQAFMEGKDVFVSLPTGAGKSLCYGILPSVFNSLHKKEKSTVIVVSPLIALMKDQVDSFTRKGIKAIHVSMHDEESVLSAMAGDYELIYISPESLLTDKQWRHHLAGPFIQKNLVAFVIDEAHCIKKW